MKLFLVLCFIAVVTAHGNVRSRERRQLLGSLGQTVGGVGGVSSSSAASLAKSGGTGLSILGLPLVGVGANYNEAVAASQTQTGVVRTKRQLLGALGGLIGGGSSSSAASVSKGAGAGISVLGVPLAGVGSTYNEAVATSQSHSGGGGFLRSLGSPLGGLIGGGSSSGAASVAKSSDVGVSVLGVPLVGVGANYNEAVAASHSQTAGTIAL